MAISEALSRILSTPAVKQQRIATCGGCEKKHETLPVCKECMCIIPAKAGIKEPTCPLNKWAE